MDETLEGKAQQDNGTPGMPIENAFRLMADTAPVMIWMSGTDQLCYYFNAGWLAFTGRTPEQEAGNGWTEGVHPLDLHRCLDIYLTAFAAQQPFKMEYRLRHHSGAYRWILDNGVPRYDAAGHFTGYIGSCIDVNDLVELEDRKDEFINAASHELKT
ncbi:MAG TPA: PAS domain-containing protein, partial [Chitinophaga sp.]